MSQGVPVSTAMMTQYATLTPDAPVEEAVQTLLRTSQSEFPVVDAAGKPVGLLGRNDLFRALKERGPDVRVADAMSATIPTLSQRRYLDEAFRILQEKSAPAVAVVDTAGKLVGLVTPETVGEMLMLQQSLPKGVKWGPWSRPAA
jgi:stage IV sporulation protein FB